jgi:Uma2 family endonuclease
MSNPAIQTATYQDILDLPENVVGEIINGYLETHPRPAPKHALAAGSIGDELVSPFQKGRGRGGHVGWWILPEPECHLSSYVLVPDLTGWRKQRMPHLPETAWFEIVPDWICRILSTSTAHLDRMIKMPLYAALAVTYL